MHMLLKSLNALGRFGLVLGLAMIPLAGLAQPANDNFTNATVISGLAGSVQGTNVLATVEPGEDTVLWCTTPFGCGSGGASIWFAWTAPTDGQVNFNTLGSQLTDTLLGAYTGTDIASLQVVAENDDIDLANGNYLSSITFTATAGTTYYLAVDSFGGFDQGDITLTWLSGNFSAGEFQFTSPFYLYSDEEWHYPVVSPYRNGMSGTSGGRVTVTRFLGSAGRVQVGYMATNGVYTNYVRTNISIAYGQLTNSDGTFTNYFVTNMVVRGFYENNVYGQYVYFPEVVSYWSYAFSNLNGTVTETFTNEFNVGTNLPALLACNNFANTNITMSTNVPPFPLTNITVAVCTNWITTNYANAAPFYTARTGLLIFDDFQMSKDILVTNQIPGFTFDPMNPYIANVVVNVVLTNAMLDPLESQAIPPPILPTNSTALVCFLNQDVQSPWFFRQGNIFGVTTAILDTTPNTGQFVTNMINFERATLRCARGIGSAQVFTLRSSLDYSGSISVPYRIDYLYPFDNRNNQFRFAGPNAQDSEILLQAGSDYAIPTDPYYYGTPPDFDAVSGTVSWGANDGTAKPINIPIHDNGDVQFNKDFLMELYYPPNTLFDTYRHLGNVREAVVTILFDQAPAGSIDRAYNPDNNANTTPPYNLNPGANDVVYSLATQPDGKAIYGGAFTAYNTVPRSRIARANTDGSVDTSFDPADGADNFVAAVVIDSSNRPLIGGAFSSYNHYPRSRIARLNNDGSLDTTFFPGFGANGTVWTVSVDTNNLIVIGGEFTYFNGTNRNHIARLTQDGSLDQSFDPGVGPDSTVQAALLQPDGKVLIAGNFQNVAGVSRPHIARMNADGTLDTSFDPGTGTDNVVYGMALQPDGRVVIAGAFQTVEEVGRAHIARLNADGSLDTSFDPGTGFDDTVYSVILQPDGTIVAGGLFTIYNQTRRVGLARIFSSGIIDTSFMDTAYNQFAGLINHYWNVAVEPRNFVSAMALQPDGNILIAGDFARVGGGFRRDDAHSSHHVARIIGNATPGPGNLQLSYTTYTADQAYDTNGASYFVAMERVNGHLGPAAVSVGFSTNDIGPGSAVIGEDFTFDSQTYGNPTWISTYNANNNPTWQLQDGLYGQNQGNSQGINGDHNQPENDVRLLILDNTNAAENRTFNLELSNPGAQDQFLLGGENIPLGVGLGRFESPFVIIEHNTSPGVLGFMLPNFVVAEAGGTATISIIRTNGTTGPVSVSYATANGTATNGISYKGVAGSLSFLPGQTSNSFKVQIIDDNKVNYDHTVLLSLGTTTGGAGLGLTNAVLTILDNDVTGGYLEMSSAVYSANESDPVAVVAVNRVGSSAGTLTAQFATTNGTATALTNYLSLSTNLVWNNGDVQPKYLTIPLLDDGVVQTNALTVNMRLFNATFNGTNNPLSIGSISNATLYITNTDSYGTLTWSTPTYLVNENGGYAVATVVRSGGSVGSVSVNFATSDGTAVNGANYRGTNGTLFFNPGEVAKSFVIPLIDDGVPDFFNPFFFTLTLSSPVPSGILATQVVSIVQILDAQSFNQPPGGQDTSVDPSFGVDGSVFAVALQSNNKMLAAGSFTHANGLPRQRMARFATNGSLDTQFLTSSTNSGPNDTVLSMLVQTDQRILVGGQFSKMNGANRNYLARLNTDGGNDSSFNPGAGPDGVVNAMAEVFVGSARKLLIGGSFVNYNSSPRNYLGRLDNNGGLDASFLGVANGPNGTVFAIAPQPDGKVLIGGDFTSVNGVARMHIARLNADGQVDLNFDPGTGANDSVRAIGLQLDGRVVIGGLFTNFNGTAFGHVARLKSNGTIDNTFNPGAGADDAVLSITIQPDTRILLGGQFSRFNGVTRNRITRLNNDGSVDTMINFGAGADSFVATTLFQTNNLIVLGGGFTHYDNLSAPGLVRVYGGTVAGSGSFEFTSAAYQTLETSTNTTVMVRRRGGTSGAPSGNVTVTLSTTDGTAHAPTNYISVITNLSFPPGEVFQSVTIPIVHDFIITPDLTVNLALSNPQPQPPPPPGGPVLGNQPSALLTIINTDSGVSFSSPTYTTPQNPLTGSAAIQVVRTGSTNGVASVSFATTTNGTAVAGLDYSPVTNTVVFTPGVVSVSVAIPILNNPTMLNDATVSLLLSNANNCLLFNPFVASLKIVSTNRVGGQFQFSQTNYTVSEGGGAVVMTVVRTNGHAGQSTVAYATLPGTAIPGFNYTATNGVLSFADGELSKTIVVGMVENGQVQGDVQFSVILTNTTGGSGLGIPSVATVTITDDDVGVGFASPIFVTTETSGAVTIALSRIGTNGITSVSYATTNGTALAGTNYLAASGTLTFTNGEFLKTFNVGVLHDPRVTGDTSFGITLFNPTNSTPTPAQIFGANPATVVVQDSDPGLSFSNATFGVFKSATNVSITVVRSNANTGVVTVNYATTNGTAIAGVDYQAVSGQLVFSNGIAAQTFSVPVINNKLVEGDRTFTVGLFNPSAGALLVPPSTASVTITDDVSGLSFSAPTYVVNENGVAANITVLRTGYTSNTVSVIYSTTNGTAVAGVNYLTATGLLTFTNGETAKNFTVTVIDNSVPDGDHTVLLNLNSPSGNAVLLPPSAATLTIIETDGSLIVPAGVALVSESGPVNGAIDPGETVTVRFAFRNATGTNTANLVATLLATNGVTNPKGINPAYPTNVYGSLPVHGPAVWRPYTFTASGTNGQLITATFRMQDGNTILSNALVNFSLGTVSNTFANPGIIVINDATNATPYPSVINVAGVGNQVSKVTATFTNLTHSWPSDIDALLVAPSGQKTYLMAKCGGSTSITRQTLTFDDAFPSLTGSQIVSGTYHPTSLAAAAPPFPVPAPPPPYYTNLSLFNGINPNGAWSLYVFDDSAFNTGAISNGWMLNLTTSGQVISAADMGLGMTASPTNVVATSNVTFSVTATNYGPGTATNIVITDTLPAGCSFVSASATVGSTSTNALGLIWSISSLATNAGGRVDLVVQTSVPGVVSNVAAVVTGSADLNADDDVASATVTVIPPVSDLATIMSVSPNPVSLGSNATFTVTITNIGPATAIAVGLTNTLPSSLTFVSASVGGWVTNGSLLTFTNLGNISAGGQLTFTFVVNAPTSGTFTNRATCSSSATDPLKANNTAATSLAVVAPSADLVLAMVGLPNPVLLGNNVTYTLTVSNLGPATASTVKLTNTLPAGVTLISANPVGYTLAGSVLTFTNLGSILGGAQTNATITIKPLAVGTITNQAACGSPLADPVAANNSAAVKTVVQQLQLAVAQNGNTISVSWPADASGYALEYATNMKPAVVWAAVTNVPVNNGGIMTVTVPIGPGSRYFRLHQTP